MSRHESSNMSAEARRELEAIDAALSDGPVGREHARLAELARELQAIRPRPSEDFARALDARAAQGFQRERQLRIPSGSAPHRQGSHHGPRRSVKLRAPRARQALGVALAAALAAAIAVPFALSGGGHGRMASSTSGSGAAASAEVNKAIAQGTKAPEAAAPGAAAPRAAAQGDLLPAGGLNGTSPSASGSASPGARQVERTATLDVGVAPASIESTAHQVFTLVSASSGYVRQSSVSSGSAGQGGASFDVRVPSSNLTRTIAELSGLGHVRSENDTTNDVTDQLSSLQSSLREVRAERASLLGQLARSSDPQQAASLKAQLRTLQARISRLESALHGLTNRITYTSLALSLTPETPAASKQGDLTPGGAARDAAQILDAALAVLVLAAAVLLPLAAIALAGWMAIAMTRRRLREQTLDAG
jgi:hypothetical protein